MSIPAFVHAAARTRRVGVKLDGAPEDRCVTDNCQNWVGPLGWASGYWSSQLSCFCSDGLANLGG